MDFSLIFGIFLVLAGLFSGVTIALAWTPFIIKYPLAWPLMAAMSAIFLSAAVLLIFSRHLFTS